MNKKIKKTLLFWGMLFAFFLKAGLALALEVHYPSIGGQSLNDTSSAADLVCYVVNLLTSLATTLSIIIIAYGGLYYLISYGRGKFTDEGKDWVKAGILGLLLTLSASLIAYTINPNLTSCKVSGVLSIVNLIKPANPAITPPSGVSVKTYKEIPIGTLTESLLTRTMDCYGFDSTGNPVDGDKLPTGQVGPTYLDHDRADCLTQLVDGAQKKSQVIAALSDEVTKLMNECSCEQYGQCGDTCQGQCDQPTSCPNGAGYKCKGKCVGAACKKPASDKPKDCCPTDSGVTDSNGKTLTVKEQIEHGPIVVLPSDVCEDTTPAQGGSSGGNVPPEITDTTPPEGAVAAPEATPGAEGTPTTDNTSGGTAGENTPPAGGATTPENTTPATDNTPAAGGCMVGADCPPGQYCNNGSCATSSGSCLVGGDCAPGERCESGRCVAGSNGVLYNYQQKNAFDYGSTTKNYVNYFLADFNNSNIFFLTQEDGGGQLDMGAAFAANAAASQAQFDTNTAMRDNAFLPANMNDMNLNHIVNGIQNDLKSASDSIQGDLSSAGKDFQSHAASAISSFNAGAQAAIDSFKAGATSNPDIDRINAALKAQTDAITAGLNAATAKGKAQIDKATADAQAAIAKARTDANAKINTDVANADAKFCADVAKGETQINKATADAKAVYNKAIAAAKVAYNKMVADAKAGYAKAIADASVGYNKAMKNAASAQKNFMNAAAAAARDKALADALAKLNTLTKNAKATLDSSAANNGQALNGALNGLGSATGGALDQTGSALNNASSGCGNGGTKYNGLDEFRCPNPKDGSTPCSNIPNFVEKQIQANNKTYTVIDQAKWKKLNLLQQETYFKEKISSWPKDSKIKEDEGLLSKASSDLSSCYLAIPYVDLVKTYAATDKNQSIVLTQKTFSDPVTKNKVDATKYCTGFNYNNSSCLKKCSDTCPDTSNAAIQAYKSCGTCQNSDEKCLTKQETCIEKAYNNRPCLYNEKNPAQTFQECINTCQDDCSTACSKEYQSDSCEYQFCQSQCDDNSQCVLNNADSCLFGADGFVSCASQATSADPGNTKYCIDNAYLCKNGSDQYAGYPDCTDSTVSGCSTDVFSATSFYDHPECQKCPDPYGPPEKDTACYNSPKNNGLPNNGAGTSYTSSGGTNNSLNANYTSSSCQQLCPETTKCPASSNCPACACDQIDQAINFTVPNASVPNKNTAGFNNGNEGHKVIGKQVSAAEMVGPQCNNYSYNDDPLTFYCEDNWWADPNREMDVPIPMGTERVCSQSGEVPVGQTVDDAKNWADTIMKSADSMSKSIQAAIDQMTKVGKAKDASPVQNYCKCDAKYDTDKPICTTSCSYSEQFVPPSAGSFYYKDPTNPTAIIFADAPLVETPFTPPLVNPNYTGTNNSSGTVNFGGGAATPEASSGGDGAPTPDITSGGTAGEGATPDITSQGQGSGHWECACNFVPCNGSPCEQVTNYLSDLWNYIRQFKLDFINLYTKAVIEPRSDIMKELVYSRKKTDSCSTTNTIFGPQERMLSCSRAEDEKINPIATGQIDYNGGTIDNYCYGPSLGNLYGDTLTDNWFCCQEFQKNPTMNNNPIYNEQP